MQKNKNRQGLALGAVFAMVASLVVMTGPAQASETSVVISPTTGLATQTTTLGTEGFSISARFGTGVDDRYILGDSASSASFGITVTKPEGVTVSATVSGVTDTAGVRSATNGINGFSTSAATGTTVVFVARSSGSPVIQLALPSRTSVSAAVALTVTPFLDLNNNGVQEGTEPVGTALVLNFVPWSALGATLSVATPIVGEHNATASFAVTANAAVNWSQLASNLTVTVTRSGLVTTTSQTVTPANLAKATDATSFSTGNTTGSARAYSASFALETEAFVAGNTISANVMYGTEILVTSATATVGADAVADTTVSPVTGVNVVRTGVNTADARVNSAYSLAVYPYSASITTSVAVASVLTITESSAVFSIDSGVSVNGTLYTSSTALLAAEIAIPAGTTTVAIATVGQTGTPVLWFTLTSQLENSYLAVTHNGTAQVVVATPAVTAGLAGAAKTFAVTAKDQWGVGSVRTDQRIAASVVLGGSTSTTVSAALVNGAASVAVTPTPATRTGSAVVTFTLQTFNQSTQLWTNASGGTPTDTSVWNVYTYVAGTDAFTSRNKVSISASVSYGVDLSWSETVTIGVLNSYSDVVVSAPGLMIQNADDATATASDTLTIAANMQAANLKFTSRLVGTYTVTYTTGTATTTSQVVFDAAAHDAGATLTFDKTSIAAGTTTTITGTLKDLNGNPVMTSGSSEVSVAWTGKGLPFGNTTAMETDASGQLTFYVLVLSGEVGDAAISATYKPAGVAVDTDNITVVTAVAVGKAAAADTKVNAGSFNGYVAVYALGHKGSEISWKIAGKWFKTTVTSDYQVFIRKTVDVGADVNVDIYITAPGGTAVKMLTKVVTTR